MTPERHNTGIGNYVYSRGQMEGNFEAMAALTFTRRYLTYNVILRSVHVRYIPNKLISFHSTTAPTTIKGASIFIKRQQYFFQILTTYGFYRQIFVKPPTSHLTEIRPVGGVLLPADRWTGITKVNRRFSQLWNAPNHCFTHQS